MRFFITGTDTDCGKTHVACLLLKALRAAGLRAAGFKPVGCGDRKDALALLEAATGGETDGGGAEDGHPPALDEVNPVFYAQPLSPLVAGWMADVPFDRNAVRTAWEKLTKRYDHLIVEGAGGWEVPLTVKETVGDLAAEFGLPVLVVVNNRLGALNHAILTVRAVQARGLRCAGLVLNYPQDERDSASISNPAALREIFPDIPLIEVMHGETEISLADFDLP